MLQDLSAEEWADTATPPLDSPRNNLQLQLGSQPMDMSMVFLSNDSEEKNTIEKNKILWIKKDGKVIAGFQSECEAEQ